MFQERRSAMLVKRFRFLPLVVIVAALVAGTFQFSVARAALHGAEWPQWRGPHRDGISSETGLLKEWPSGGPTLAWKTTGAGAGYSSFAVTGGKLYTLGAGPDREFVVAFDASSGKRLWQTPHGRRFSNDRGDGPRGTPTVEGNLVYAFGASGDMSCLDAPTGRILWTLNVLEKFGGRNINWGLSESPLVLADRILLNPGAPGASIVALSKKDGSLLWKAQGDQAGYSSAVTTEVGGIPEAVFFTHIRALGVDTRDGRLLWD